MINHARLLNCLLLMGIPFFVLIVFFGINYSGFCFSQMRYLSNEEKIHSVFDYQIVNRIPEKIVNKTEHLYTYIGHTNFYDYIKENPNCCTINSTAPYDLPPPSFLDRITGYNSGDVISINFTARYLDKNSNQKFQTYKAEYAIQNCGKIKEW